MSDRVRKIIRTIAAAALAVSLGALVFYAVDDLRAKSADDKVSELKDEAAESSPLPDVLPEYSALVAENSDTIGWLKIEGTGIDYVVMQAPDELEKYLHLDFYGEYSYRGCLFVDEYCNVLSSDNIIIYGHNMKDGSMFGELMSFVSEDYWREHKTISFDSIYEKHEYEVVAAIKTEVLGDDDEGFKYYEYYESGNDEKLTEYSEFIEANRLYDTGVSVQSGDRLLTLSTCAYHTDDGRFIVVAREIS